MVFLEGYAAFTRDAPLAGRNLGRNAEDPIVKGTCVITYTGTVWGPTGRSTGAVSSDTPFLRVTFTGKDIF